MRAVSSVDRDMLDVPCEPDARLYRRGVWLCTSSWSFVGARFTGDVLDIVIGVAEADRLTIRPAVGNLGVDGRPLARYAM